jgi:hypothetical protein
MEESDGDRLVSRSLLSNKLGPKGMDGVSSSLSKVAIG